MTFVEFGLAPELVAALAKQQIAAPTRIQQAAMPVLIAGRSAWLEAETGTGKTLAYLLPIFAKLALAPPATQAIVLAPTHELAIQIHRQSCDLAQNAGLAVKSLLLIGGTAMDRQIDKLKGKPHIVVGSPGRVRELMKMGKLKVAAVRTLVLDEADRLLTGESLAVIRAITDALPAERQVVFASATQQDESTGAIGDLAPGALTIRAGAEAVNENIRHLYVVCDDRDRIKVLRQLLHAMKPTRALVFAAANELSERATAQLDHHGVAVAELHPDFSKLDRKQAMDDFRAGRALVMIASDMAARGLDFPEVTHVFNLDAPKQPRAYLHRAGRTGRAGRSGDAVTLIDEREIRLITRYEKELGIELQRIRLREGQVFEVGSDEPRG